MTHNVYYAIRHKNLEGKKMSKIWNESIKENLYQDILEELIEEGWTADSYETYEEAYKRTKKEWEQWK